MTCAHPPVASDRRSLNRPQLLEGATPAERGLTAYRPEIDGLRAVAIVPVVLFHAKMPGMGGGFVGVDVFFVISGFLITSLLAAEVATARFSLATFYERRIRRIFPALFAVLGVSTLLALWLLLPAELESFARSLLASTLFVANLYYMGDTGYFVGAAETKPLLHMWSLAVEEQFYIVFPICLFLLHRHAPRLLLPVTVLLAVLSFLLCLHMTHPQSDQAFYFSPARAWELLAGSILALMPRLRARPGALAEGLAAAGIGLIGVAVVTFDETTLFPGTAAVLPVAGAALVIWATADNRTMAGSLLSVGPVRFFGLISYSLYLWHWPLLVFYRFWRIAPPAPWEIGLVVLAAVGVSTLSWRYIEHPFRRRTLLASRARLFAGGLGGFLALAVLAGAISHFEGLPGRVRPELLATTAAVRADEVSFADCRGLPEATPGGPPLCATGDPAAPASFVVWGDSHGGALLPAFDLAARETGRSGLYLGASGCVPLLGVDQIRPGFDTCSERNATVFAHIAAHPEITTVVLVGRWAMYALGERFLHEAGHSIFIRDAETRAPSHLENHAVFARGLDRTLGALQQIGRRVVIVAQVPESEFDLPVAMARASWLGRTVAFDPTAAAYDARQAYVNGLFRQAEASGRAQLLDLRNVLCSGTICPMTRNGIAVYRDGNHLTASLARTLAPQILPVLAAPPS